jgi:hypothetical protein
MEGVRRASVLLIPLAFVVAGCGSSNGGGTPAACLAPVAQYLKALKDAPSEVRLAGETPISDCISENQAGGEIETVGQSLIQAATQLNGQARRDPGGSETVQLGYLDGAVHEAVPEGGGINADLLRRLESAVRFNPEGGSPGASFERAFGKGYAAGQDTG